MEMRTPYRSGWKGKARRFLSQNLYCVDCGAPSTDAAHVIPRSADGPDTWDNLEARCHPCHSRRTIAMRARIPVRTPARIGPANTVVGRW